MTPDPNLAMLERIAEALGPLRRRMVFLGGSATGLLITDPAAAGFRGRDEYAASHDLEDLVSVVDGRDDIVEEVAATSTPLRSYLRTEFGKLILDGRFLLALPGHLPSDIGSQARLPVLLQRLLAIAGRA